MYAASESPENKKKKKNKKECKKNQFIGHKKRDGNSD
jgi:hypothetical protein